MPKEQGERAPCMAKNAKDKSNSATLLAARAKAQAKQDDTGRSSRCSSEKDSGYSDTGSDSLQTDSEDQRSAGRQPRGRLSHQGSHQGGAMLINGGAELAPIFIIKNVVLKQPGQAGQEHLLQTPLSWGAPGTNGQAPTHVLLLQQPDVTSQAPLHILKPQPQRADGGGGTKKNKSTYLPILNSYPRIAPHPNKKADKTLGGGGGSSSRSSGSSSCSSGMGSMGGSTEDHCQSKRVCTEEKREEVSTTSQLPKQHVHKQPESKTHSHGSHSHSHGKHSHSHSSASSSQSHLLSGRSREHPPHVRRSPHPPSSPSTSASLGSPSVSSTDTGSPPSCELPAPPPRSSRRHHHHHQNQQQQQNHRHSSSHGPLSGSVRHRRFLNTVEILSRSGLLDITLRTQELLRQSAATERDIAQLRQHTQMLCQAAAQGGSAPPDTWDRLHQAMAQSGHYPTLGERDDHSNAHGNLNGDTSSNGDGDGSKGNSSSTPSQVQAEADTSTNAGTSSRKGGEDKVEVVVSMAYGHGIHNHADMAPPSPLLAPIDDLPLDLPLLEQNGHDVSAPVAHGSSFQDGQSMGGSSSTPCPLDDNLMPPDSSTNSPLL